MRKGITLGVALLIVLTFGGLAQATEFETRGSAVALGMNTYYYSATHYANSNVTVTNITGSPVNVRVKFYDHDGNDVTSYITVYSGNSAGNGNVIVGTGTDPFEVPAGSTRYVVLSITNTSKFIWGHAVIEWSSPDSHLKKALMAYSYKTARSQDLYAQHSININGGEPF